MLTTDQVIRICPHKNSNKEECPSLCWLGSSDVECMLRNADTMPSIPPQTAVIYMSKGGQPV